MEQFKPPSPYVKLEMQAKTEELEATKYEEIRMAILLHCVGEDSLEVFIVVLKKFHGYCMEEKFLKDTSSGNGVNKWEKKLINLSWS